MEYIDGIVMYNNDPQNKGRVKIFVPGIFKDSILTNGQWWHLPWAEPAMSIFGGGWTGEKVKTSNNQHGATYNDQTGYCSVPQCALDHKNGSQVFVFFEAGDVNKPIYFAVAQSGSGWLLEHPKQHVIQTDSVRIRIDETPESQESTCKHGIFSGSANSKLSELALNNLGPKAAAESAWGQQESKLSPTERQRINFTRNTY